MSETVQSPTATPAASSGAAVSTPAPTPAASPAPATPAASPAPKTPLSERRSKGALAAERAAKRISDARAQAAASPDTSTAKPAGQAPGAGDTGAGASTQPDGDAGKGGEPASKTADGEGKPSASTVSAPADWPKDRQERFNKLAPEAQQDQLAFYKEMQTAFHGAMTQLAEERARTHEAATFGEQYAKDPKGVIAELAKRANLEIFFERPLPEGEIPAEVMSDPKKLQQWIADEAVRKAQRAMQEESDKREQGKRAEEARGTLQREFAEAEKAHNDFGTHRPKVVEVLKRAPALTVEEAYQLATLPQLIARVNELEKAKTELSALKAEQTRRAQAATRPIAGVTGLEQIAQDPTRSPGERAYARAAQKKQAGGNRPVTR